MNGFKRGGVVWCGVVKGKRDEQTGCGMLRMRDVEDVGSAFGCGREGMGGVGCFVYGWV